MADKILLAPQNTAGTSNSFIVKHGAPRNVYLYPVADLTASEYADLQRKDPAGTWQDVYDHGFKGSGGQVRLDTTVTDITVVAEGEYRIDMDNPTNSIGVAVGDTVQS